MNDEEQFCWRAGLIVGMICAGLVGCFVFNFVGFVMGLVVVGVLK